MAALYFLLCIVLLIKSTWASPPGNLGNRDDRQDQELRDIWRIIQQQADMIQKYGNRIESLENHDRQLVTQMEQMETDNSAMKTRLEHLEKMATDTTTVKTSDGGDSSEASDIDIQGIDVTPSRVVQPERQEDKPSLSRIRKVSNCDGNSVGFYVQLVQPNTLHLGQNQVLEFDGVITNTGNGYDARHGHFTAPVSGLYSFTSTILLIGPVTNTDMHLAMVRSGAAVGYVYSSHGYDEGTRTIVLSLGVGDRVWIQNNDDNGPSIDHYYSTFSGFLIASGC